MNEIVEMLEEGMFNLGEYLKVTYPNDDRLKKLYGQVNITTLCLAHKAGLLDKKKSLTSIG